MWYSEAITKAKRDGHIPRCGLGEEGGWSLCFSQNPQPQTRDQRTQTFSCTVFWPTLRRSTIKMSAFSTRRMLKRSVNWSYIHENGSGCLIPFLGLYYIENRILTFFSTSTCVCTFSLYHMACLCDPLQRSLMPQNYTYRAQCMFLYCCRSHANPIGKGSERVCELWYHSLPHML